MAKKQAQPPPSGADGAEARLSLPALLSRILVAFTIEVDNAFEERMPHRTTRPTGAGGARGGPWLGSLVLWSNGMQYIGEGGITVGELQRLARTKVLLVEKLAPWGYVVLETHTSAGRKRRRADVVVRPTAAGRKAQEVWRPLPALIEKRWQTRFGKDAVEALRTSLSAIVEDVDAEFPDYLPVVGYGLLTEAFDAARPMAKRPGAAGALGLPALLSKVLLALTLDFERGWPLSLPVSANVLRLLTAEGVSVKTLPRQSGVSKEAIETSLSFLVKRGLVALGAHATDGRTRVARLTPTGKAAQQAFHQRLQAVEEGFAARFGPDAVRALRASLEHFAPSLLFLGMEPHASGWRASLPRPEALPHHPMVLHRGGFPDGA